MKLYSHHSKNQQTMYTIEAETFGEIFKALVLHPVERRIRYVVYARTGADRFC